MEQLTPLLNELAAQMGTTVEFLWSVLIKQAFVSAMGHIVLYVVYLIFVFGYFKYIPSVYKKYQIEMSKSYSDRKDEDTSLFIAITATIMLLAITGLVIGFIPSLITKLANPEYWALQQILEVIK